MVQSICKILIPLFILSCGTNSNPDLYNSVIFDDVLSLEISFGTDFTDEDFLLVNPHGLYVTNDDDIIVFDELKMKIYDAGGLPKSIVGREGEGPGEFTGFNVIRGNENGYVTVFSQTTNSYSVFSPELEFIKKINLMINSPYKNYLENLNYNLGFPRNITAFNENEVLFQIETESIEKSQDNEKYVFLFHYNGNELTKIANYSMPNAIKGGSFSHKSDELGSFSMALLPDNRIAYTHSFHESTLSGDTGEYIINILSLDDFSNQPITKDYDPVLLEYSDETLLMWKNLADDVPSQAKNYELLKENVIAEYNEREFKSPVQKILADRNLIYVFTYKLSESGQIYTDLFDSSTLEYTGTALFPFVPNQIQNSFAYRLTKDENEFEIVEKYTVNQKIYGN